MMSPDAKQDVTICSNLKEKSVTSGDMCQGTGTLTRLGDTIFYELYPKKRGDPLDFIEECVWSLYTSRTFDKIRKLDTMQVG